jgi:hypothetical protein
VSFAGKAGEPAILILQEPSVKAHDEKCGGKVKLKR